MYPSPSGVSGGSSLLAKPKCHGLQCGGHWAVKYFFGKCRHKNFRLACAGAEGTGGADRSLTRFFFLIR